MGAFSNKNLFSFSFISDNKSTIGYGLSSIVYPSKIKNSFLQIGFLYKRTNGYELKFGRWKQGITSESKLSTGSLIRGNNSIPIPQISLMTHEYKKYQFLGNNIGIKAGFSHGWFSKGEYLKAPYLHEKYLYIRNYINDKSEFTLGLVHEAIWGGTTNIHGQQPGAFEDYFRVIFARPASSSGFIGEQVNVLGNHLGVWDYKVKRHTDAFWCSALVGFVYVKLGLLPKDFDWSNWAPCDFSGNKFILTGDNKLETIVELAN